MRKEAYITLVAVFLVWIQFGCDPIGRVSQGPTNNKATTQPADGSNSGTGQSVPHTSPQPQPTGSTGVADGQRTFLMGSFNIRDFGRTKVSDPERMAILVEIGRRFDLLAVQEISDISQQTLPKYVNMLNENGMNYAYVIGPRQGDPRVAQKEQYAYIYDANKLEVIGQSFVAPDPENYMQRSPLVTSFRCIETTVDQAFTFSLFNVHTDYDVVTKELLALQHLVENVVRQMPYEDDFIILGDLNAAPKQFSQYPCLNNQVAVVPDNVATNTRGDKNYDNIIFDANNTLEYRGNYGVFDFMSAFSLTYDQAKTISDHMPVWAEFSIYESSRTAVANSNETIPSR